jgi:hypothetical protein
LTGGLPLEPLLQPSFVGYFGDKVLLFAWTILDLGPPIAASCVAGMAGTCHLAQVFIGSGGVSQIFLPGLTLSGDPPDLHLLSSCDYRCEQPHPVKA